MAVVRVDTFQQFQARLRISERLQSPSYRRRAPGIFLYDVAKAFTEVGDGLSVAIGLRVTNRSARFTNQVANQVAAFPGYPRRRQLTVGRQWNRGEGRSDLISVCNPAVISERLRQLSRTTNDC